MGGINLRNVSYHGGDVLLRSVTYAIFWEPSGWPNAVDAQYHSLLQQFFQDVGGSGLYNVATQYYDQQHHHIENMSSLGGACVDSNAYPTTDPTNCPDPATPLGCIDDTQIQTEVASVLSQGTLGWTPGLQHVFFVFTAPGEGICASKTTCAYAQRLCGYHWYTSLTAPATPYAAMPYADFAYNGTTPCRNPTDPNGDPAADDEINVASHELMETVTDPKNDAWYSPFIQLCGLVCNFLGLGAEIGDLCSGAFGPYPYDNSQANEVWNGHYYAVQQEWSNASASLFTNGCVAASGGAYLFISPSAISLTSGSGKNPAPQQLAIENPGDLSLYWQLTSALPSWLAVTPTSGTVAPHRSGVVTLTFSMPQTPQTYTTTLTFLAPPNQHVLVPVSVTVQPLNGALAAVAAVSASDVWAVGSYTPGTVSKTLIERWDGLHWNLVPSPNVGSGNNSLSGVVAVSASDAWAVGVDVAASGHNQTLIEHYDGTGWNIVPSVNPGSGDSVLTSVAAVSASDVWAVGYESDASTGIAQTLTEHWDGTSWSVISSPNPNAATSDALVGVTAVAANDVWAVGAYDASNAELTLTEHWDGTSWSVVSSPNASSFQTSLSGVAAISTSDVWAVGTFNTGTQPLTEHWDGTSWSTVSSPNPGASSFQAVTGVATNDVWAVGATAQTQFGVQQTLTEHWNGSQWSVISSPDVGSGQNNLYGVAAVSTGDVWAVGFEVSSTGSLQTLTEQWNGSQWSVVPSP